MVCVCVQVASLSAAEAELLLHHLKWNKDELLNRYLSDHNNILLTEAGLRPDMDRPQPIEGVESVECPVCLESFADTTLSLTCGHKCCTVRETMTWYRLIAAYS